MTEGNEKKVEYLELIYDLIFVYLIGRNNSLLHHIQDGFVTRDAFFIYILCSLAVIQIWSFSTFYINLYGRNGIRDHIFLFINMYLLYHMADGISTGWQESFFRFCVAWFLILVNIGVEHLIEMRHHKAEPWVLEMLKRKAAIILGEAGLVIVHMLVFIYTGVSIAYVPVFFGILASILSGKTNMLVPVDFGHLSERAMLYVVFTFGEMIISITSYFEGKVTVSSLYFSFMAFLIVAGLFLCYEIMYNHIIDREMTTNGTGYMLVHVFLILALNNISVALEFMREEEVNLMAKTMFITGSFLLYFVCLFLMGFFARERTRFKIKFCVLMIAAGISFMVLMLLLRSRMYVNIAISLGYVMAVFFLLYRKSREEAPEKAG